MFNWFRSARSPVDEATRDWVAWRFQWLVDTFGPAPLQLPVVCPTVDDFPEQFDGSPAVTYSIMRRIADRIGVESAQVDLDIYEQDDGQGQLMRSAGLEGRWSSDGAAGYFVEEDAHDNARFTVAIERSVATHPSSAVATIAHELCHARLLGGRYLTGNEEDGEPLTDLATVFFGYGLFTANALVRESSWQAGGMAGWSVGRQGYLTYPILGFALATFAVARGEDRPRWMRHLRPDARAPFRQGLSYLRKHGAL